MFLIFINTTKSQGLWNPQNYLPYLHLAVRGFLML